MNFSDLASDFELPDEGAHTGVLVSWIDRGTQPGKFGSRRQVGVRFELPDVQTKTGEPSLVFMTIFNLSLRSKNFREMSTALIGSADLKGIPLREMLGKSCKVTIIHRETDDGQTFANIASFKALKPGTKTTAPESPIVFFSLAADDIKDLATLERDVETLPESERLRVKSSTTYTDLISDFSHAKGQGRPSRETIEDDFPAGLGI